jgi:copper chaperone
VITLNVPSIACEVCAKTITTVIKNTDPQAEVNIDVETKIVQVNTTKTLDIIQEAIIEAGHSIGN